MQECEASMAAEARERNTWHASLRRKGAQRTGRPGVRRHDCQEQPHCRLQASIPATAAEIVATVEVEVGPVMTPCLNRTRWMAEPVLEANP